MEFVRTVIKNSKKLSLNQSILLLLALWGLGVGFLLNPSLQVTHGPLLTLGAEVAPMGKYHLKQAMGMAVDDDGQMYVADHENNRVVIFSASGRGQSEFGSDTPTVIATAGDKLYVGNMKSKRIRIYTKDGELLDTLPHKQDQPNLPEIQAMALTVDQKGNIYASDTIRHRIVIFRKDGSLFQIFGQEGYQQGQLNFVDGLVVDEASNQIIALDANNLRLVFFNRQGKFIKQLSFNEIQQDLLLAPRGLVYNPATKLFYITDTLQDKVVALTVDGKVKGETKGVGLNYPHGIDLGPNGFLYVTNREKSIITLLNS